MGNVEKNREGVSYDDVEVVGEGQEIEDTGKDKSNNSSDVVGEVNESGSEKDNILPSPNEPDRGIYEVFSDSH